MVQGAGEGGARRVELLGKLLSDGAATGIATAVQSRESGPGGAVEDIQQHVGVEVLVLDGDLGLGQLGRKRQMAQLAAM